MTGRGHEGGAKDCLSYGLRIDYRKKMGGGYAQRYDRWSENVVLTKLIFKSLN